MPDSCLICGSPLSLGSKLRNVFNAPAQKRCEACTTEMRRVLEQFRADFINSSASGILTPDQWHPMWQRLRSSRTVSPITWREDALTYIQGETKHFLDRLMNIAYADGIISPEEDDYFDKMVRALLVDESRAIPFRARWTELKRFSSVRQGHLPVIGSNLHLDAGELCHFQDRAQYAKHTAKGVFMVPGQLIATSKRVHFLAADASGWTIQYDKILRLNAQRGLLGQGSLTFELSTKKGAGTYHLSQTEWAELIFSTIIRINKRHIVSPTAGPSRHIPQHVKTAVWQRDAGRCAQCGADDYLEFDHIIPHSKGGASTVGNVQLLCRRCNNEKSDRI